MQFHIASHDGLGPDAFFSAPQKYTDNPLRYAYTHEGGGGNVHESSPVYPTDAVFIGSGTVLRDEALALTEVRESAKVVWEYTDGRSLYLVRIFNFVLDPIGGGKYTFTFEFRPIRVIRRVPYPR